MLPDWYGVARLRVLAARRAGLIAGSDLPPRSTGSPLAPWAADADPYDVDYGPDDAPARDERRVTTLGYRYPWQWPGPVGGVRQHAVTVPTMPAARRVVTIHARPQISVRRLVWPARQLVTHLRVQLAEWRRQVGLDGATPHSGGRHRVSGSRRAVAA